MTRKLRPALELVSAIGSLGFDLQHHAEKDIAEAVAVLRKVNPEMFDWIVRQLAAPASSPSPAQLYECADCRWCGPHDALIQAGLNHELCPKCEGQTLAVPRSEHPAAVNYLWVLEQQILPNQYGLKRVALIRAIEVLKSLPSPPSSTQKTGTE